MGLSGRVHPVAQCASGQLDLVGSRGRHSTITAGGRVHRTDHETSLADEIGADIQETGLTLGTNCEPSQRPPFNLASSYLKYMLCQTSQLIYINNGGQGHLEHWIGTDVEEKNLGPSTKKNYISSSGRPTLTLWYLVTFRDHIARLT